MKNDLLCYGATVPGHKHIKELRNNQDGYHIMRSDNLLIGVVTDGCTTSKKYSNNEVGAKLFPSLIAKVISDRIQDHEESVLTERFWHLVSHDVLTKIGTIADMLPGRKSEIIKDYLLFTIVGFVVYEDMVTLFNCGDGVYGVNNKIQIIKPSPTELQPYLSYQLTSLDDTNLLPHCRIKILDMMKLEDLHNLIIATDGLVDILSLDNKIIPMTKTPAGQLAQFWSDEKILANPHIAQNKLAAMNKKSFTVHYENREVTHFDELMEDDTTFIVLTQHTKNSSTV